MATTYDEAVSFALTCQEDLIRDQEDSRPTAEVVGTTLQTFELSFELSALEFSLELSV